MDDVKQLISEGVQLFKEDKLQEAIVKLKEAVEQYPSSIQAHCYLGAAYSREGENPSAVEQFQAVVDLEPASAAHTFNLGQAVEAAGNKPRAISLYEKALTLDPKYARARQRLDALTGGPKPATVTRPMATTPPAQTASIPGAPSLLGGQTAVPSATLGGQPSPYGAPPQPAANTQYGAPPARDPSLGLGRHTVAYGSYSSSPKRFVAALIDGLILGAVFVPIYFAMAPPIPAVAPGTVPDQQMFAPLMAAMSRLQWISIFLSLVYYVGFNGCLGATPGKMALGMKILKTDGSKIGVGTAFGRYLLQTIFAMLTCGGLSYISILVDSANRGWHDKVMDTMVVDK